MTKTKNDSFKSTSLNTLANHIKAWGKSLGFQQVGISDLDLNKHSTHFKAYIEKSYHGNMEYLARNIDKREDPAKLHEDTCRIISVRMNYLPPQAEFAQTLSDNSKAYISRYALGRDYHKLMRSRLKQLSLKIQEFCGQNSLEFSGRPFVDSAPVLEHAIAEKAGIGWTGKHTLTINKDAGSWFFLGELFINLPLPLDKRAEENCGACTACISICPTKAIIAPYQLDARRCISYLTIELKSAIPEEFREAIGNRIYGCDDCQLVCPWNRYADISQEKDFFKREVFNKASLVALFLWNEQEFLKNTEGSPIRRIGHVSWRRNISVAMGNADYNQAFIDCLQTALDQLQNHYLPNRDSEMLKEHYRWALNKQQQKAKHGLSNAKRQHERLLRIVQKGLPRDA